MSRMSCDQYRTVDGKVVEVSGMDRPPVGAILWNGYDYNKQEWVFEGKKDTRSLEQLQAATLK